MTVKDSGDYGAPPSPFQETSVEKERALLIDFIAKQRLMNLFGLNHF